MTEVKWEEYAKQYDMMAMANPEYQKICSKVKNFLSTTKWSKNPIFGDFGGGTGNFSKIILDEIFDSKVYFLDYCKEMINVARSKLINYKERVIFIEADITKPLSLPETLDAIFMIHTLYATKSEETPYGPKATLENCFKSLKNEGYLFLLDIGRKIDLTVWANMILGMYAEKMGNKAMEELIKNTNIVREENIKIAKEQAAGRYFTHTLKQLSKVVSSVGFKIIEATDKFYNPLLPEYIKFNPNKKTTTKGIDDLIIAIKP